MEEPTKSLHLETGFLHYVSPAEFTVPQETISQSIKGGLGGLWKRIRNRNKTPENPGKAEADLQALPDALLDCIAPNPDWEPVAKFLKKPLTN